MAAGLGDASLALLPSIRVLDTILQIYGRQQFAENYLEMYVDTARSSSKIHKTTFERGWAFIAVFFFFFG